VDQRVTVGSVLAWLEREGRKAWWRRRVCVRHFECWIDVTFECKKVAKLGR
jgi:hypothetical protein